MPKRLLVFLWIFVFCRPSFLAAEIIDRVVAVVNDDIITLSELNEEGKDFFKRITEQTDAANLQLALQKGRSEVLSRMIDRKIITQKAEEMNITVNDSEIDAAIQTILALNNSTEEKLKQGLEAMGVSEKAYRDTIREQILQSKLINYEVSSKIVITEEKANEYYNKEYMREIKEGDYYLLHMGFSWDLKKNRTKEQAMAEARQVRERVMAGESFKELARTHSDLPSAAYGGDIGAIRKDEMAQYMRDTVTTLRPGEISPIVETDSSYQFFQLLAVKEGGIVTLAPFAVVKEDIIALLHKEEQEKQFKKWVEQLREKTYIKELL